MARFPRHTNARFQAAIEWVEANGWTINRDGSITRVRIEVKIPVNRKLVETHGHAPSYRAKVDGKILSFKARDIIAAKFGHTIYRPGEARQDGRDSAAIEQPDRAEVEPTANLSTESRSRPAGCDPAAIEQPDEAKVGLGLNLKPETRTRPAGLGRCARCGGQVVGRISYPGDPPEQRCVQCGRSPTPANVEVSYTPVPENEPLPVALAQE